MVMASKRTAFSSLIALAAGALALILGGPSRAEFPERPIELVCANKEGSAAAKWCAMMAKLTGEALGQSVEVVLKPGGQGSEAASYVASRPADGHTWARHARRPCACCGSCRPAAPRRGRAWW